MSTTAVVTGANQGLSRALVAGLAGRLGPAGNVYLTGRDAGRVAQAARELQDDGLRVLSEVVDVTSAESVDAFAALVAERQGHVDLVLSKCRSAPHPRAAMRAPPLFAVLKSCSSNDAGLEERPS